MGDPTGRLAAHAGTDGRRAEPQRGELQARRDPRLHEGAEPLVGAQLLARRRHILAAHELRVTAPLPGEAHLVVRPVLARGIGLARTGGLATHVVLFGERAGPEVAQRQQLLLQLADLRFQVGLAVARRHRGRIVARNLVDPADVDAVYFYSDSIIVLSEYTLNREISPMRLRMAPQLSFADLELQRQGLAVDATLHAIGELLEAQPGLIERVRQDLVRDLRQPHTGRDGLTAEQTLRAYVLKQVKNWDLRELRDRTAASRTRLARSSTYGRHRFCLLDETWRAPQGRAIVSEAIMDFHLGVPPATSTKLDLPMTQERRCPGCQSEHIQRAGHFIAGNGMIKSEQRCEACGTAFWFARERIP
jgi:hypothetical protein